MDMDGCDRFERVDPQTKVWGHLALSPIYQSITIAILEMMYHL
jgi:hypothetical protein